MGANGITDPVVWNFVFIGGDLLPGIAKVIGAEFYNKLDVQQGTGTSGAKVVYHGREPKPFKIELQLLTEDDFDEWLNGPARRTLVTPPVGKKAVAFDVFHPSLDDVGITSALLQSISPPEPDGTGGYKVVIECMPQSPPKPSTGTPSGSKTKWEPASKGDEKDQQIDDLVNQAKQL